MAPSAPEDLQLEGIGPNWILFSWTQSPLDQNITRYIIAVSRGGIQRNVTKEDIQPRANVTGLQPGTEYTLQVVAVAIDEQMSPLSVALVATTSVPGTHHHTQLFIVCSL